MIRMRTRLALSAVLGLGIFPVGCHKGARVQRNPDVGPAIKDTASLVAPITDPSVVALFKDTAVVSVLTAEGQTFKLANPGQRQSLRATLRKERELWKATKPLGYRFLLRVACFCPGTRGWLLVEVRGSQPLRAWDRTGKSAALTDWNTFSIDGLYDNLERAAEIDGQVRIAFDPRWHFPAYVYTVALPGPDAWSIIEVRALRPL
jgi:hypothetical protein